MNPAFEQQLISQSPFAALFTGMVMLGGFVNYNATDSNIEPSESWCKNKTLDKVVYSTMPKGLDTATLAATFIFPIVPMILNSKTKKWNDFKVDMMKCHILGSGSVFGVSETLRHFLTIPEADFLNKC